MGQVDSSPAQDNMQSNHSLLSGASLPDASSDADIDSLDICRQIVTTITSVTSQPPCKTTCTCGGAHTHANRRIAAGGPPRVVSPPGAPFLPLDEALHLMDMVFSLPGTYSTGDHALMQATTQVTCHLVKLLTYCLATLAQSPQNPKALDAALLATKCDCMLELRELIHLLTGGMLGIMSGYPMMEWKGAARSRGGKYSARRGSCDPAALAGLQDFHPSLAMLVELQWPASLSGCEALEFDVLALTAITLAVYGRWTESAAVVQDGNGRAGGGGAVMDCGRHAGDDSVDPVRATQMDKDLRAWLTPLQAKLQRMRAVVQLGDAKYGSSVELWSMRLHLCNFAMMAANRAHFVVGLDVEQTAAARLMQEDWFDEIVLDGYDLAADQVYELARKAFGEDDAQPAGAWRPPSASEMTEMRRAAGMTRSAAVAERAAREEGISSVDLAYFWNVTYVLNHRIQNLYIMALVTIVETGGAVHMDQGPNIELCPQWLVRCPRSVLTHLVYLVRLRDYLEQEGRTSNEETNPRVHNVHKGITYLITEHSALLGILWKLLGRSHDPLTFKAVFTLADTCVDTLSPAKLKNHDLVLYLVDMLGDCLYYLNHKLTMGKDPMIDPAQKRLIDVKRVTKGVRVLWRRQLLPVMEGLLRLSDADLQSAEWHNGEQDKTLVHRAQALYHCSQAVYLMLNSRLLQDGSIQEAFESQAVSLSASARKVVALLCADPRLPSMEYALDLSRGLENIWKMVMGLGYMHSRPFMGPVVGGWYEMKEEGGTRFVAETADATPGKRMALLNLMHAVHMWVKDAPPHGWDPDCVVDGPAAQYLSMRVCSTFGAERSALLRATRPDSGCFNMACTNLTGYSERSLAVKTCAKCKQAWYCCPECQKADWKRHKKECGL